MRSWPRAGSLVREVGDFPNRKQSNSLQLAIVLRRSTLLDCFSHVLLAARVARKRHDSCEFFWNRSAHLPGAKCHKSIVSVEKENVTIHRLTRWHGTSTIL